FFQDHPHCSFFARIGGSYEYIAGILAKDPIWLSAMLSDIVNRFSSVIDSYEISTRIHAVHFPKQYLLDAMTPPSESTFFGGSLEELPIDAIDETILHMLATNARTKFVDIASVVGISDTAVGLRVRNLEKLGILTGYFAWIEPSSVNHQSHNLLVKCK